MPAAVEVGWWGKTRPGTSILHSAHRLYTTGAVLCPAKLDVLAEVGHLALRVDGSPRESLEPLDGAVLFWNTVENARVPGFFGLPQ